MSDSQVSVLIVFANPRGTSPLRLGTEDRAIRESIKLSRYRDNILLKTCHASTIHDLRRALLEDEFQIVHISGHGTEGGLVLEDELGGQYVVPQQALADLLKAYSPPLKCVILNACFSLSQGQLMSLGVPFTIAMEGTINDDAAIEFSRGFYDAIGAKRDIDFAYEEGCRSVKLAAPGKTFVSQILTEFKAESKRNPFPYDSWTAVNEINWSENIVTWFENNFYTNQLKTTEEILKYVALIAKQSTSDSIAQKKVIELGKAIFEKIKKSEKKVDQQFVRVFELLSLGLHHQHSHLFAAPKVYISNLIYIPDYSSILLATKYSGFGNYQASIELLNSLSSNCPLASYIVGQAYRKLGKYNLAESYLNDGLRDTDLWHEHKCPYNKRFSVLCNGALLKSSILRAKAVIQRKQKKNELAENNYILAEQILETEIKNRLLENRVPEIDNDDIQTSYNVSNLNTVLSDIYFSHGYYWYENKNFDQGKLYFSKSIEALERSDEEWDSPYTRLAIIELVNGNYENATQLFTKAYIICAKTPIQKNREASISKALCTLGLKVLEVIHSNEGLLTTSTPLADLKSALSQKPPLTLGPLECHRDDAKHMLAGFSTNNSAKQLIDEFIYIIEREINATRK